MGFFGREKIPVPPHPRREPRIDLPLCLESLEQVFDGCVDFSHRAVDLGATRQRSSPCATSAAWSAWSG